ncbi:glycerol-3-phosphate 1-O-acyltransferase PlsY [Limosilactobacillus sp.]|jgi:glycerol-3-phosphate acyltransferase PlsY|uniref:glycerol-3-phosphate 1-O-acyltransferase PlsY n=1 Tax=Limosilactobacillus sp. TaxID=2773925 RepID=UPI0025BE684E|nr:glycerol-3-phosphate 1-O-acyltransferase PlsY [Limosilactobacillus sp.]MCH3922716.1 glycerol-3-phosphate 1-O-acyltransferase PlsY [Limosilactobacillus sp.]MCH3927399.1 glycerol-3-phosphate 1-O-acyltransferase PlsY [Limosilactobacillus sp.]
MTFKIIIMVVVAYLLGSIPSGLWIGQIFYHKDIRKLGSGNIGTTNTFRTLGPKAGTVVLFMDVLKGTLAACQPYFWGVSATVNPLLIGLFASLGHTASVFDHFHGGKAVATSAGILLAYNPPLFGIACLIFITTLLLTSMASCASIIGISAVFVIALCEQDWILTLVSGFLTLVVLNRHRSNIKRIFAGTESMVGFGLGHYLREHHQK